VGKKKPNAWGLYDMHGNASEWVLDHYQADFYARFKDTTAVRPLLMPDDKEYPYVSKGGSYKQKAAELRVAARLASDDGYSVQDPQVPQSIWWHTDARHIGFRICRPLDEQDELKNFQSPIKSENGR
jgi:formylglycine-generating enzyme required for sulfatase activity